MQLVERCEAEFGFDSGVKRVVVLGIDPGGRYVPRRWPFVGKTIVIHAAPIRSRVLPEYVFHEMGHAVREGHDLEPWLSGFCRRRHEDHDSYEEASDAAAKRPRPAGYVSGYATCDRDDATRTSAKPSLPTCATAGRGGLRCGSGASACRCAETRNCVASSTPSTNCSVSCTGSRRHARGFGLHEHP